MEVRRSTTPRERAALAIATVAGLLGWFAIALLALEAEAFDDERYFMIVLPVLAAICVALGFWVPERAWRFGVVAVGAQAGALVLTLVLGGAGPGLLAPAIGMMAVIACAMAFAGVAGARARRASDARRGRA